jgi:TonB family protein
VSEEIVNLPTENRDDIYLHITDRDTALFVLDGEDKYYLYHLVSGLSETDRYKALVCTYSRVIYPQHARSRAIGGTVVVDAYLNELGCVVTIDPKTDIGYGLEKATIRAIKKCSCDFPQVKFQNEFVKSVFTIPLKFKLD